MRIHDSQAYRKMYVTRERISRILELREILLSFQTGFSLVNAAVVCAILESISRLEPSLDLNQTPENRRNSLPPNPTPRGKKGVGGGGGEKERKKTE